MGQLSTSAPCRVVVRKGAEGAENHLPPHPIPPPLGVDRCGWCSAPQKHWCGKRERASSENGQVVLSCPKMASSQCVRNPAYSWNAALVSQITCREKGRRLGRYIPGRLVARTVRGRTGFLGRSCLGVRRPFGSSSPERGACHCRERCVPVRSRRCHRQRQGNPGT